MTWRTTSASDAGVVARLRLGSERCGLFKGCIARQGSGCLVTCVQGRGGRSIAGWSACRAWPVRRNQSSGAAWAVPSPEDRGSRWRVAPVRGGDHGPSGHDIEVMAGYRGKTLLAQQEGLEWLNSRRALRMAVRRDHPDRRASDPGHDQVRPADASPGGGDDRDDRDRRR